MLKSEKLEQLKNECFGCRKCSIGGCKTDGKLSNVFSNMNVGAKIMVVGQNPGKDEVDQGTPFVGVSGKFFDKAISEALDIDRSDLYISNIVRCFTNENRRPNDKEIANCRYLLDAEIKILKPKCIVTLGGPALRQLTGMSGIKKHHGKVQVSLRYGCYVLPLFHPSPTSMKDVGNRKMFYDGLKKLIPYLSDDDSASEEMIEEILDEKPFEVSSCHWCSGISRDPVWHKDKPFCKDECLDEHLSYMEHSKEFDKANGKKFQKNAPRKRGFVSQSR